MMHAASEYLPALLEGDVHRLAAWFGYEPLVEDPRRGRIRGRGALEWFVAETAAWLSHWRASLERVGEVVGEQRRVGEAVLHLAAPDEQATLPIAVVVDGPHEWRAVRVYHSMWPLIGAHRVRPPLLPPVEEPIPDVVGDYQRALAGGDLAGILAVFEPEAVVREPAGAPYVYRGREQLSGIYARMFASGGGIPLQHCTVTDDGTAFAIEYNVTRWGGSDLPPQAGVAVYVRGSAGGLAAARIYDDVEPPMG